MPPLHYQKRPLLRNYPNINTRYVRYRIAKGLYERESDAIINFDQPYDLALANTNRPTAVERSLSFDLCPNYASKCWCAMKFCAPVASIFFETIFPGRKLSVDLSV